MLRQIKPRTARSKRALSKRAPHPIENPKTALFLRSTTCSQVIQDALSDLYSLHLPHSKKFTKKNAIHPFEDATSLEFFSEKNDASFLVFGSSSKKRPHALTFVRTFDFKVLDRLELYLDNESYRQLKQFRNERKCAVGLKPMLLFCGTPFENPVRDEYTLAKSMFVDFFKGEATDKVDVEGLQYIVVLSVGDEVEGEAKPKIHLRVYLIRTKKSGQRLPRVEVEEMGPRMDFRVGRMREADEGMEREALRKVKGSEEKSKKNVKIDLMGDKVGRIHLGRQDLKELQTRKMKGLKRSRDLVEEEDEEMWVDEVSDEEPVKKSRRG